MRFLDAGDRQFQLQPDVGVAAGAGLASALDIMADRGEPLTMATDSASGPRTSPLTSTVVVRRSGSAPRALNCSPAAPAKRPCAPLIAMLLRSNTSSPAIWVNAGQLPLPCVMLRGT
jgi:hypothetical protein